MNRESLFIGRSSHNFPLRVSVLPVVFLFFLPTPLLRALSTSFHGRVFATPVVRLPGGETCRRVRLMGSETMLRRFMHRKITPTWFLETHPTSSAGRSRVDCADEHPTISVRHQGALDHSTRPLDPSILNVRGPIHLLGHARRYEIFYSDGIFFTSRLKYYY